MAKYRKRPVIVEAYQTDREMTIPTLEGDHHASVGDYIITGVKGEQYPCKPDIFLQTYESVEDEHGEKPPTNDNDGVFRVAKNGRITLGNNEIPFVTKYNVLDDADKARPIVTLTFTPSNVEIERYEYWD